MNKYVKVMFDTTSGANPNLRYKINEINIADKWNPKAANPKEMGGFNFSTEDKVLRWLVRGDTIYDVEIPKGAEVIDIENESAPHGVFRSNKIILKNPRKVTDEMAMELYKKSNLPEKSYYKALAGLAVRSHKKTAIQIIRDKVNKNNIDLVLSEVNNFLNSKKEKEVGNQEVINEIVEILNEINSTLLISLTESKKPYQKKLTTHKIINITGESGSGKSTFVNEYVNNKDYIIIDTDIIFGNKKPKTKTEQVLKEKVEEQFGKTNLNKILIEDFDRCYDFILKYFKDINKTIIIDSAQYRNIKDVTKLKGEIIIIRTSIDECYKRCITRYNQNHPDSTKEQLENYKQKKKKMYSWYKSLNEFIIKVDKL